MDKSKYKKRTYIFRTFITLKDGRKIYAKDYGLKAFKIYTN